MQTLPPPMDPATPHERYLAAKAARGDGLGTGSAPELHEDLDLDPAMGGATPKLLLHRLILPPDLSNTDAPCCGHTAIMVNTLKRRATSRGAGTTEPGVSPWAPWRGC